MSLDLSILGQSRALGAYRWSHSDTMLYALAIGCGSDDLRFVTENSENVRPEVFPTFSTIVERRRSYRELGDVRLSQLLHAGQSTVQHAPFPVEGSATTTSTVTDIFDTGEHALVVAEAAIRDDATGVLLATNRRTLFVRGGGGFGGEHPPTRTTPPEREPDATVALPTAIDQALLYRLTGDRNPLHSDPVAARRAGFKRPILHGLCTIGVVARALLARTCQGNVDQFGALEVRFRGPVVPGDTVDLRIWDTPSGCLFEANVGDRAVLEAGCLDRTPVGGVMLPP